ncbi:MAG: lytic transglycosylase domain-containing protein [Pseudomonadota bacterium]
MKRIQGLVLLLLSGVVLTATASVPYRNCFERSANDYDLGVDLLMAVSAVESNWKVNARSHANAHGLMQIQWPGTARHLGVRRVSELYKPCTNIALGARYLRELLDRFDNDEARALAAYNYGPGRIERAKTLPNGAQRYVARVVRKRAQLTSNGTVVDSRDRRRPDARSIPAPTVMTVRSRGAARRYLRVLERRVRGADFSYRRLPDGRHGIQMLPRAAGLSDQDRLILKTMGWEA